MLRRLPRRRQPMATTDHGWVPKQQAATSLLHHRAMGHVSGKSPYVDGGNLIRCARPGKGRHDDSSSWGG
jgi:hypothetical protein